MYRPVAAIPVRQSRSPDATTENKLSEPEALTAHGLPDRVFQLSGVFAVGTGSGELHLITVRRRAGRHTRRCEKLGDKVGTSPVTVTAACRGPDQSGCRWTGPIRLPMDRTNQTADGQDQLDCRWTGPIRLPMDWTNQTADGQDQSDCRWTGPIRLPMDWTNQTANGLDQSDCRWTGPIRLPMDRTNQTADGLDQSDCRWTGPIRLPMDRTNQTADGPDQGAAALSWPPPACESVKLQAGVEPGRTLYGTVDAHQTASYLSTAPRCRLPAEPSQRRPVCRGRSCRQWQVHRRRYGHGH